MKISLIINKNNYYYYNYNNNNNNNNNNGRVEFRKVAFLNVAN